MANEKTKKKSSERKVETNYLWGLCALLSEGTLNVKPVLSFTRFKGLVTARNHAARVHAFLPFRIR